MKRMAMFDWNAMKCFHLRLFLIPIISLAAGFISALLVVPTNVFMFLFFSVNTFAVEEKGDLNKVLENLEELEQIAQSLKLWVKKNL